MIRNRWTYLFTCKFINWAIRIIKWQSPLSPFLHNKLSCFVGKKAKERISKRAFQENKAHQIFRKTNISYPLIPLRTCAYQEVRNYRFSENLTCFVFLNVRFEIRPFALLPTTSGFYLNWILWEKTLLEIYSTGH